MAFQQSSLKFALFFTFMFMITVDVSGVRDVARDVKMMKLGLIPINVNEMTCDRSCSNDNDCSDGWTCRWCKDRTNPFDDTHYSSCSFIPWNTNIVFN